MEKLKQEALVLALVESLRSRGSWCGETHVQKCTHFLQEGLNVPLGFEFVLYKHGPFSFDLRQLLAEMRANLLIDVQPQPHPYGPSLLPGASASALAGRFRQTRSEYQGQVDFVAEKLARMGVGELERLSTALLVHCQNPALAPEVRARRITELKPHIPEHLARGAVDHVDRLLKESRPT